MGKQASNGRVTNALIHQQLKQMFTQQEQLSNMMTAHQAAFNVFRKTMYVALVGDPEDTSKKGVVHRVGDLEEHNKRRQKYLWVVYTTLVGLILTSLPGWIHAVALSIGMATPPSK